MHFLARNLPDPEQNVEAKFESNQCVLRYGNWTVASVLVEGSFPKYEDVIPRDNDVKLELGRESFLSAVRRAALLTTRDSKGVRFALSSDQMVLSSRSPEQGEATITLPISYAGGELEIGFNPHFLIEVLRALDEEKVVFELKEANRPGIVRCGTDFLYVVMPVSLN
jgi:DNA polymerase-3 subunit beta